jgi:hypothetical protein
MYLEALVLQDTLDGRIFTTRRQLRLEDDTERAVADNLALRVREVFVVAGQAVLDLFADNFCGIVSMTSMTRCFQGGDSPPILSDEKADGRFWLIVWCYACGRGVRKRCADCWWGVWRTVAEQSVGEESSLAEQRRGGLGCRREVECQEGVVPRAVCAVPGDACCG